MERKKKSRVSSEDAEANAQKGGDEGETLDAGEWSASDSKSLYEIPGVERNASQQEIKKAYYKLLLRLHPDKNPGDEEAKEKFQLLQKVISILGDEEKRAVYDETGYAGDDTLVGDAADNLQEYFRTMYKRVTEADIEEFEASYRGSDSEKKDLKDLYVKFKGNMNRSKKQVGTDIVAVISQRRNQRKEQFNSKLSSIMANCGTSAEQEPSEEEFQKARQRLEIKQGK
ncbi:chaperone protein dnaJ 6-like [Canna indica]|uniref:Chaperone protein dnaJ 6-like n=1 Tax=Canna indica TaxID=4628 RepID=A0AAQ3K1C8_9LILI|nr:chaperone protein dnaJ 6-like [Canna indica]